MFTQKGSFIMKKSRTFRKSFVAAIAALCLAAPLTVMPMTVSADTTYSITITATDSATTHKYVAYQIFKGDLSGTVLSNIQWGDGVDSSKLELTKLNGALGLTGNAELTTEKLTASNVAKLLTNDNVGTFAEYIANCLTEAKKPLIPNGDYATDNVNDYIVTDLSAGYYLVEDEATLNNQAAAKTSYILRVVDNVSTNAKSAVPTIVKKVQENTELENEDDYISGSGKKYDDYNDVADYNIGDDVPFLDDGTLPSDFDSYDDYYYQIVDTPGDKFTPNITGEDGKLDTSKITVTIVNKDDGQVVEKEVWVDGDNVKIEYVDTDTAPDTIKVTFKNIKDIYEDNNGHQGSKIDVDKNSHVTIEYTAKLDEDAVIGLDGQESKVELNFSNDPNEDYESTTDADGKPNGVGTTPEDKVIVFTYELDITKYLGSESASTKANDIAGTMAGFEIAPAEYEDDGTTLKTNLSWSAEEYFTNENGLVEIKGLDDGKYVIRETTTPTGYNTMPDMVIEIKANAVYTQSWAGTPNTALTDVDLLEDSTYHDGTADGTSDNVDKNNAKENGVVNMKIINQKGSTLPSTGGIGTTIFYLGGGTMAAVAGVYLITKKRMKNEEDDEI